MYSTRSKIAFIAALCFLLCVFSSFSKDAQEERHIKVVLRMIGHQVLLNSCDSTSLVLPIEKYNDRYRIPFNADFEFNPEDLVATIDKIAKETKLTKGYNVEVEQCETGKIVYSYEVYDLEMANNNHCSTRALPKACYSLLFTLIDPSKVGASSNAEQAEEATNLISYLVFAAIAGILIFLIFVRWRKKNVTGNNPNLIPIGKYQFDKRNTELIIKNEKIELTSKEADLLLFLYNTVNTTVEREVILNMVWGDDGDYVGRTLDVFISKLRKKLEADSSGRL